MKKNIKIIMKIFMINIFICLLSNTAFADRLDKYCDIIKSKQYTIVYTFNIKNKMQDKRIHSDLQYGYSNSELNHVLIRDLDDAAYSENGEGRDKILNSILYKNGEMYRYCKTKRKDSFKYYGDIEPLGPGNIKTAIIWSRAPILKYLDYIVAIASNDSIWKVEKVGDNVNSQGYNCEDYKVTFSNYPTEVIRFIFDGEILIEMNIAGVSAPVQETIKFSVFSNEINRELLELPKDIKVRKIPKELVEARKRAAVINEKRRGALDVDDNGTYQMGGNIIVGFAPPDGVKFSL